MDSGLSLKMDCPAKLNLFNLGLELGYILQMEK